MAADAPFPLTGPLPESLAEIREQINYWSTRQNEGEPGSFWEQSVKNRLEALKWKERELAGSSGKDARYLSNLRRLLARAEERDRKLLLYFCAEIGGEAERTDVHRCLTMGLE